MKKRALDRILYSNIYGVDLDTITKKKTKRAQRESQEKTYEYGVVKERVFQGGHRQ